MKCVLSVITQLVVGAAALAQGSAADYERANGLRKAWRAKAVNATVEHEWLPDGRLWYSVLEDGKPTWWTLDPATGKRAAAEKRKSKERPGRRRGRGRDRGRRPGRSEARSPDEVHVAFLREHDVWVRKAETGDELRLTSDGSEQQVWQGLSWSFGSRYLVAHASRPGPRELVHLVESSPVTGGRAKLTSRPYALPGDVFTTHRLAVFDLADGARHLLEVPPFEGRPPRLHWHPARDEFLVVHRERGHQRDRVFLVDAATRAVRTVLEERAETFLDHYRKGWWHITGSWDELLWMSERSGWNHIHRIDVKTGRVSPVTRGHWVVRRVRHVDEAGRRLFLEIGGYHAGQDPYLAHHARVDFDGGNFVLLTEGDGHHEVSYSPDHEYLVDRWSRVDAAPVTEVRRVSDGKRVAVLAEADISALRKAGWKPPETFVAPARDGKTPIWGLIYRPTNFDPDRSYPVIEDIYAGPHGAHVPKTFAAWRPMQSLAELGFIVVKIDGMGTNHRSKAFHDVCWKNVGDAGLPDRIAWIKAAARKYPQMDISRVGIYGTSAGGQSSTGALLFHGDFYKVAVSSCGCHDNRMDKASWNEQWMGYPVGPHYEAQSNVTNAHKLQGKLMLIVGELDRNVPPESTLRVVDALIKADKDFDLLVIPGAGHTSGGRYGERRRRDFFVRHLLGREPRW